MLAIMFLAVLSFEGLSAKNAFVPDSKVLVIKLPKNKLK
jgi:hypothetical protein